MRALKDLNGWGGGGSVCTAVAKEMVVLSPAPFQFTYIRGLKIIIIVLDFYYFSLELSVADVIASSDTLIPLRRCLSLEDGTVDLQGPIVPLCWDKETAVLC